MVHPTPRRILRIATAALVTGVVLSAGLAAQKIAWHGDLATAQAASQQGEQPLFIAWTMPQGRGDEELCSALTDKSVAAALGKVAAVHYRDDTFNCGEPKRGRGMSKPPKANLPSSDLGLLLETLGLSADAMPEPSLVVLLKPDGECILHHVGRIRAGELVWLIERAVQVVDPEGKAPRPRDGVHAPLGVVFGEPQPWNKAGAPLSKVKRQEQLEVLQRRNRQFTRRDLESAPALLRLADKGAQDVLQNIARGSGGGRRGRGLGGANLAGALLPTTLQTIGLVGPRGWSGFAMEQAASRDERISTAAAQALEQLADPGKASALLQSSRQAESTLLRGHLLRAAMASAPTQKKIATELDKILEKAKDPVLRLHAMLAYGHVNDRDRVLKQVRRKLGDGTDDVRRAAALVAAWLRDPDLVPALKDAVLGERDAGIKELIQAALDTQETGGLDAFRAFAREHGVLGLPGRNRGGGRNGGGGGGAGGGTPPGGG